VKAIVHSPNGNPAMRQVATLDGTVPRENGVLTRVKAAGLDYGQWLMAGKPYVMQLPTAPTRPTRRVLGMDVSGVGGRSAAR
jgi:NADPH:quinone reductase-like Zn-dependent oxidoreductase